MNLGTAVPTSSESVIAQTVLACTDMASTKTGALIVFERTTLLNDQMGTGTIVNADVTSELLRNIFSSRPRCTMARSSSERGASPPPAACCR